MRAGESAVTWVPKPTFTDSAVRCYDVTGVPLPFGATPLGLCTSLSTVELPADGPLIGVTLRLSIPTDGYRLRGFVSSFALS